MPVLRNTETGWVGSVTPQMRRYLLKRERADGTRIFIDVTPSPMPPPEAQPVTAAPKKAAASKTTSTKKTARKTTK